MPYPILSLGASVYVSWIFGKIDESDDIHRLVHLSVSSWAVGCVNCTDIKSKLKIFACTVKGRLLEPIIKTMWRYPNFKLHNCRTL